MAMGLRDKVVEFLKSNPGVRYTAKEIANYIFEMYPNECNEKRRKSERINTDEELLNQIASEITISRGILNKRDSNIEHDEERPRRFYYSESSSDKETESAESADSADFALKEDDLYGMLSEFLLYELKVHSKRIDHTRARNAGGAGFNKWLFPDIVGLEDIGYEWDDKIKICVDEYYSTRARLWSFEVKNKIKHSNIREYFFQAISNSSWANFGYLVAAEIEGDGEKTIKELRMLSRLHGIGFIKLDVKSPVEKSHIMIPALQKDNINWDIANRLLEENQDFSCYIDSVRRFHQTGDITKHSWDVVSDDD